MGPRRVDYLGTRIRLAASLGDSAALNLLSPLEREGIDDAFSILMSCSDSLCDHELFDFGKPTYWPYDLEAAMRIALAVFREFLADWRWHLANDPDKIPSVVTSDFAPIVISKATDWVVEPSTFDTNEADELYDWIKNDVCLDGYLANQHPEIPPVVNAFCYGALHLIEIENCQDNGEPMFSGYHPTGRFSAETPDAISCFVLEGCDIDRMRTAACREVGKWCLGERDPLLELP